jgi:uncharacterized membrane protein YagU involved in acid resistance
MSTTAVPAAASPSRGRTVPVVVAGLAGGAVDVVYASLVQVVLGRPIARAWQGVASGWLGGEAMNGGAATVVLGLVTHFGIAISMAAVFALAASRLRVLYRRPLLAGVIYGLGLYVVMYRIVLPLRFPSIFPRWDGVRSITDILAHIGVALGIALVLSRSERRASEA